MKKIMLALMVLGFAAMPALAGVEIDWLVEWGAYTHNSPDASGSDFAMLDNYSVTWQLIYAGANGVVDEIDLGNGANGWVSVDDEIWATRSLAQSVAQNNVIAPEDNTEWSNWMTPALGFTVYTNFSFNTSGYVFQRVYEGAPAELSWYYESPLLELVTTYTATNLTEFPQQFVLGDGGAGTGFIADQQIPAAPVPEPMTMGLMGLGALALAIRRRHS